MKALFAYITRLIVLNIVLIPLMMFGPLFYVLPLLLVVIVPNMSVSCLAELYFWLGPLSCAFYMCVSCHWQTVRRAQREGRLKNWRDSEGGVAHTVAKATIYMFGGLFGSFLTEFAYLLVWRFALQPFLGIDEIGKLAYFAILPFATYAPVLLLWLRRWMRSRKQGDFISRAKGDRDKFGAASFHAKNIYAHVRQQEEN